MLLWSQKQGLARTLLLNILQVNSGVVQQRLPQYDRRFICYCPSAERFS